MSSVPAISGRGGKGSTYRPVDKKKFDRNFISVFGITCPKCDGLGCHYCEKGKIYSSDYYHRLLGGA